MEIVKERRDRLGESRCYECLGVTYCSLGDFRKSIEFLENAINKKRNIRDRPGESKCYNSLGNAYYGLLDFNRAIEYFEKSLQISKELEDRL